MYTLRSLRSSHWFPFLIFPQPISVCVLLTLGLTQTQATPAAAPGTAQDQRVSVEAPVAAVAPSALPNFHQVHPYLYRGGEPSPAGLKQLQKMGIKTVIDLRAETRATRAEKAELEQMGLQYKILPMSDKAPTEKQVDTFMQTVRQGRDKNEPVFVHCAHGSDRTGCMVGIWRVSEDGFSYDQAYKEMRKYYFGPKFVQLSGAVKKRAAK
ncbi:MAG: dual specificity protein phosphatase family protein [Cyanobacteria bacterium SZAS LIN-2]|nr:dual specificity protein phosphatase family protein [Cyanobacteria bacterium SZAS LIN-2]